MAVTSACERFGNSMYGNDSMLRLLWKEGEYEKQ